MLLHYQKVFLVECMGGGKAKIMVRDGSDSTPPQLLSMLPVRAINLMAWVHMPACTGRIEFLMNYLL